MANFRLRLRSREGGHRATARHRHSPRQYNIGKQVCLLKLEFDERIESVFPNQGAPRPLERFWGETKISNEVSNGSGTTEAFADDTNVTCKQKLSSLLALKSILNEFANISGLKCNLEKTCIMFIGPRDPVEAPLIEELGFTVVNNLKILGFIVGPDGIQADQIFRNASAKINQIIGCWSRFNLSLKGRIAISKTMLVSQITYLGPIMSPDNNFIGTIQNSIDSFVIRGMPMANDRKYAKTEKGGLGLIKLTDLFDSLKCSWFKRILSDGINDNWRLSLMKNCFNNLYCFRPYQLDNIGRPVESDIGIGFWRFLQSYWQTNNNYLDAPIVLNPLFSRGMGDNGRVDPRMVDEQLIGRQCFENNKETWLKLKVNDLFLNDNCISYEAFLQKIGFYCTFLCYMHIRKAVLHAKLKYGGNVNSNKTCVPIANFMARKPKGCSYFRKILGKPARGTEYKGTNIIRTFFNIIGIDELPDTSTACSFLGLWNLSIWPIRISTFVYHLYHNSLPVAARLGNRYKNAPEIVVDERCFWCRTNFNVPGRETFSHVYFDCPITSSIFSSYCNKYLSQNLSIIDRRKNVFLGMDREGKIDTVTQITGLLLLYCIWEGKIRKKNLSFSTVEANMFFCFDSILENNKWVKSLAISKNDVWCRSWRGRADGRRG